MMIKQDVNHPAKMVRRGKKKETKWMGRISRKDRQDDSDNRQIQQHTFEVLEVLESIERAGVAIGIVDAEG